jgi:hypothetical protein
VKAGNLSHLDSYGCVWAKVPRPAFLPKTG